MSTHPHNDVQPATAAEQSTITQADEQRIVDKEATQATAEAVVVTASTADIPISVTDTSGATASPAGDSATIAASSTANVETPGQPVSTDQIFLAGLTPPGEFMQACADQPVPSIPWQAQWTTANAYRQRLASSEAGIANNPSTKEMTPEMLRLLEPVFNDAAFQAYQANFPFPAGFVLAPLDRLAVFQRFIELYRVERHLARLSAGRTDKALIDLCFPLEAGPPVTACAGPNGSSFFFSDCSDMRPLGGIHMLLKPEQLPDNPFKNRLTKWFAILAVPVGYCLDFLHVIAVENRLILFNGSHRAYALRHLGETFAPCFVQSVTRAQLKVVAENTPLGVNPDAYLDDPRPPLFKDYFDPRLNVRLSKRPGRVMARVRLHPEIDPPIGIPA